MHFTKCVSGKIPPSHGLIYCLKRRIFPTSYSLRLHMEIEEEKVWLYFLKENYRTASVCERAVSFV